MNRADQARPPPQTPAPAPPPPQPVQGAAYYVRNPESQWAKINVRASTDENADIVGTIDWEQAGDEVVGESYTGDWLKLDVKKMAQRISPPLSEATNGYVRIRGKTVFLEKEGDTWKPVQSKIRVAPGMNSAVDAESEVDSPDFLKGTEQGGEWLRLDSESATNLGLAMPLYARIYKSETYLIQKAHPDSAKQTYIGIAVLPGGNPERVVITNFKNTELQASSNLQDLATKIQPKIASGRTADMQSLPSILNPTYVQEVVNKTIFNSRGQTFQDGDRVYVDADQLKLEVPVHYYVRNLVDFIRSPLPDSNNMPQLPAQLIQTGGGGEGQVGGALGKKELDELYDLVHGKNYLHIYKALNGIMVNNPSGTLAQEIHRNPETTINRLNTQSSDHLAFSLDKTPNETEKLAILKFLNFLKEGRPSGDKYRDINESLIFVPNRLPPTVATDLDRGAPAAASPPPPPSSLAVAQPVTAASPPPPPSSLAVAQPVTAANAPALARPEGPSEEERRLAEQLSEATTARVQEEARAAAIRAETARIQAGQARVLQEEAAALAATEATEAAQRESAIRLAQGRVERAEQIRNAAVAAAAAAEAAAQEERAARIAATEAEAAADATAEAARIATQAQAITEDEISRIRADATQRERTRLEEAGRLASESAAARATELETARAAEALARQKQQEAVAAEATATAHATAMAEIGVREQAANQARVEAEERAREAVRTAGRAPPPGGDAFLMQFNLFSKMFNVSQLVKLNPPRPDGVKVKPFKVDRISDVDPRVAVHVELDEEIAVEFYDKYGKKRAYTMPIRTVLVAPLVLTSKAPSAVPPATQTVPLLSRLSSMPVEPSATQPARAVDAAVTGVTAEEEEELPERVRHEGGSRRTRKNPVRFVRDHAPHVGPKDLKKLRTLSKRHKLMIPSQTNATTWKTFDPADPPKKVVRVVVDGTHTFEFGLA